MGHGKNQVRTRQMPETIELSDEVIAVLHEQGGTFDTPDDVFRRILEEAGYDIGDEEEEEWTREELKQYFDNTRPSKQRIFLQALVEFPEEWVPKEYVFDQFGEDGINVKSHTMDGVQSAMTRRCGKKEKFWESSYRDDERKYRIVRKYREIVEDYWGE